MLVAVPNPRLGNALRGALADLLDGVVVESGSLSDGPGGVVVTTPAACSPVDCRRLAQQGTRLIVISPMALVAERRMYESSGAFAYLPMQIDATELIANAVKLALHHHQRAEGRDSLTARSHELSPRAC